MPREVEGLWPCFVHFEIAAKSRRDLSQWMTTNLKAITSNAPTETASFQPADEDDLHISITPTMLLQQHEFEQTKSLVYSLAHTQNLKELSYERSRHWAFLEHTHIDSCAAEIQPFQVALGKLKVLGNYLAFEIPCEKDGQEIRAINAYFCNGCAFYNQESYEDKCLAEGKLREFHCSLCKIDATPEEIQKLKAYFDSQTINGPPFIEICGLEVVN